MVSPGQRDPQIVSSSHKLNMRRNLRWVPKRTRKITRKYTEVAKKQNISRQQPADKSCISAAKRLPQQRNGVTQLALTWIGWPNGQKLTSTFMQTWSRPKWAEVNTSARKAWPNGVPKIDSSFQLATTCDFVWPRLNSYSPKAKWTLVNIEQFSLEFGRNKRAKRNEK